MLPIMAPDASDDFMNSLLTERAAHLGAAGYLDSSLIMVKLVGRRAVYAGPPDYLTDLAPLMDCNTNSYRDIARILRHLLDHYGHIPLVLRITGDGQTVQFLSYVKRRYPDLFKHILITNGHWHSSGHFMLQGVRLFWPALYKTTTDVLQVNAQKKLKVHPTINNLEGNSYMHYQHHIVAVDVATTVYILLEVTDPPPDLFLRNPVQGLPSPPCSAAEDVHNSWCDTHMCIPQKLVVPQVQYISQVKNASGIVLMQAMRHVGAPTLKWLQCVARPIPHPTKHTHTLGVGPFKRVAKRWLSCA